jgi:hypothetical protein
MVMTRAAHWLIAIAAAAGLATLATGCNKPTPDSCRAALTNMQRLMGTDNLLKPAELETEVRSCRGGSTKQSVECAIKATTLAELHRCDFYKLPPSDTPKAPDGSAAGSGSATGSATTGSGSATTGSGSAAAGSGSAAPADKPAP